MGGPHWAGRIRLKNLGRLLPLLIFGGGLFLVRLTKGAVFLDTYAFLSRPFWPGPAQKEWLRNGFSIEQQTKLRLLEQDNRRLRVLLALKKSSSARQISAAVISRQTQGWWHQLEIGKGQLAGISADDPVLGPGGLLGRIQSVTPTTARVRLLTSPSSRIGVWVPRTGRHGLLVGMGTSRTKLVFLDKGSSALPGDVVSTSPASTLLPPNLPVGVIQSLNNQVPLEPQAVVQLIATPAAVDWVQVQLR